MSEVSQVIHDHLKESFREEFVEAARATSDSIRDYLNTKLSDLESKFEARVIRLQQDILQELNVKLNSIISTYETSISSVRSSLQSKKDILDVLDNALRSIPAPNVRLSIPPEAIQVHVKQDVPSITLPDKAIQVHVNQETPQVSVNIPKDSIKVQIQQDTPQVIIPKDAISVVVEQKPSQVTLEVPENAIQVQVDVSQQQAPRITERKVVYDPTTGRPDRIVEVVE